MESFLKKVVDGKNDSESHRYFIRFGKGRYNRRFLMSMNIGKKIKVKTSFELANDLVKLANQYKVSGVPTIVLLDANGGYETYLGSRNADDIIARF